MRRSRRLIGQKTKRLREEGRGRKTENGGGKVGAERSETDWSKATAAQRARRRARSTWFGQRGRVGKLEGWQRADGETRRRRRVDWLDLVLGKLPLF